MVIKKKLIALILMIMVTPSLVNAATVDVICPEKVKENTDFTCTVKAISDTNINNIIVKYRYSDKITYKNIELKDNWIFLVEDNPSPTKFGLKNETEKTGDITLADITYNASNAEGENLYIEFYDFDATNNNADVISFTNDPLRKNIHVKSTNNKLKTLTIDNENITLEPNQTNYTYTTNKAKVNITAELDDTNATCDNLNRTVNLTKEETTVTYKVTAEDGTEINYTITIINNNVENSSVESNTESNNTNNGIVSKTSIKTGDNLVIKLVIFIGSLLVCTIIIILRLIKKKKRLK